MGESACGAKGDRGREATVQPSLHSSPSLRKRRDRDGEMLARGRKEVWKERIEEQFEECKVCGGWHDEFACSGTV